MAEPKEKIRLDAVRDPPRDVPLSLQLRVLFGGMFSQMGWFFLGFGLIFVWVFVVNIDFGAATRWIRPMRTVPGTVLAVEATKFSEGGDEDEDGTPVYRVVYRYSIPGSGVFEGTSFSTGRLVEPGSPVSVRYVISRPQESTIEGLRRNAVSPGALIVIIFPLIGLVMVGYSLWEGVKSLQLLHLGRLAYGTLVSSDDTGIRVNERPVVRVTFEYEDHDGQLHEVVTRTKAPEEVLDEPEELILYDPRDPGYAIVVDALPGSPDFDAQGELLARDPLRALLLLVIPLLTVLGHGIYLLFGRRFGS
jgi:hypothetical protein